MASEKTVVLSLCRTATAAGTGTPKISLVCDGGNITADPKTVKRINNATRFDIGVLPAGFDIAADVSGAECDAEQLGYLFWLALGGQSMVTDKHVLVPAEDPQYAEVFIDRGLDLGSGTPTEVAQGAMIEDLSFELPSQSMAKVGVKLKACTLGDPVAALTASAPPHPISFISLRSGDFKIGYNGNAIASDRTIKDFKMNFKQATDGEDNITIDSDQPTGLTPGAATLDFEITRKFEGANALAEYNAWKNQQEVAIQLEVKMNSDTESVLIDIPHARPVGNYAGGAGTGGKSVMGTLKCEAFVSGSDELITVTVDDGTIVDYT